jgi:hypothetical protein
LTGFVESRSVFVTVMGAEMIEENPAKCKEWTEKCKEWTENVR